MDIIDKAMGIFFGAVMVLLLMAIFQKPSPDALLKKADLHMTYCLNICEHHKYEMKETRVKSYQDCLEGCLSRFRQMDWVK